MVQWVEKVAHLLLAIYWLIWEELNPTFDTGQVLEKVREHRAQIS
jgi:hypothetical protein